MLLWNIGTADEGAFTKKFRNNRRNGLPSSSYCDMTREEWEIQLKRDNFGELWIHEDPPEQSYPEHSHPVDSTHVVLRGSMVVTFEGHDNFVGPGDRIDVGKHVLHSAKIGSEGCVFLMGVRI